MVNTFDIRIMSCNGVQSSTSLYLIFYARLIAAPRTSLRGNFLLQEPWSPNIPFADFCVNFLLDRQLILRQLLFECFFVDLFVTRLFVAHFFNHTFYLERKSFKVHRSTFLVFRVFASYTPHLPLKGKHRRPEKVPHCCCCR